MNFLRSVLQIFSDRIDQTTVSFTKRINKILVKSAIENTPMSNIRDKPFIVICGCTGTGKTKLSIQMAQWLMKNNKNCEIINADAMQTYKNLDIITNKATDEEMKGIKHNLIGYIDNTCRANTVGDYVKKAVSIIDRLLEEDKIPILVGGTNYYIHSVLYDALIDTAVEANDSFKAKIPTGEKDSELVNMILDSIRDDLHRNKKHEENQSMTSDLKDLNVRIHDADISNEILYAHLQKVDSEAAKRIHPNDRRKIVRALQIYYTCGQTKTELQNIQNNQEGSGSFHGPIRYKNVCIFALNAEDKVLNKRLDDRVDQMIENGLLNELKNFKLEFDAKNTGQSLREFSRDYQFGIFQSIGFKEFDAYFEYLSQHELDENKAEKDDLFQKGVEDMKAATRRYARIQMRWIKNRFVKRANEYAPIVHEVDTSDVSKWDEEIFEPARIIFENYLNGTQQAKITAGDFKKDTNFEYNKCNTCDRVFVDKFQWNCHLKSGKHKKRLASLKAYEKQKRKQHEMVCDQIEGLKRFKENEAEGSTDLLEINSKQGADLT